MTSSCDVIAAAAAAGNGNGSDFLTGRQLTTFNRPSRVHVGAKRDSMDNVVRPFHGKITGQLVT